MIHQGVIGEKEKIEALCKISLPDEVFSVFPTGARYHVVLDRIPERVRGIVLTQTSISREMLGVGWILAAGPMVLQDCPYPGGPSADKPEDLLYQRVIFGQAAGMPIRFDFSDPEFRAKSPILVLESRAIRAIDLNPMTFGDRLLVEEEELTSKKLSVNNPRERIVYDDPKKPLGVS